MNILDGPANILELLDKLKKEGIPSEEYRARVNQFLDAKARKKGIPLNGVFELTPLCNLDCKMCYVHLNNHQFSKDKLLSVDVWKNIIDQAREAGMLRATLTGGECLTYPGFDELYLHLYNRGIKISILSNGLLMDEQRVAFFRRYHPNSIQITLYGSSDEEYEAVAGHRVFSRIYHNLCLLRDAGLAVSITITPNRFMKNEFTQIIETVEKTNIPYHINSALITPRDNTGRERCDLTDEQYIEIYKLQSKLKNRRLVPVDPSELPDPNTDIFPENICGIRCGAGRSSFTIQYDGSMSPCVGLNELLTYPLKSTFIDAWHELNAIVNHYPIPSECMACIYHDVCITCAAMHKNAPKGHCDRRICERTKKLISAGLLYLPEAKEYHQ